MVRNAVRNAFLNTLTMGTAFLLEMKERKGSGLVLELCADELVVGGGVGWSYDRRQFHSEWSQASAESTSPRIFHRRRRRRRFMVGGGGVRPDERALKQRTRRSSVFFWFYRGQPLHL